MRQLRKPARPDRPDQPPVADRRIDAGVPRDEAPVPRPAAVRRAAARVDRLARRLAHRTCGTSRLLCIDDLRARPITRDLDWGVPIPVPGYAEDDQQAHLRLVRRRDRVPVGLDRMGGVDRRPRRLARMVAEPRIGALLLPGEGQHRLSHRDLAGDAARLRRGRRLRRRARPARPPGERRRHRVPDLLRQAVLDEPRATRSTCATSSTGSTPTRSATTSSPRARRRRTPTSPGPSSCAATTTSCLRTGGTSSTAR